jgi:hypothetical protein
MRKQLFAVHYINRKSEEPDVTLLVSDGANVREEVGKAIAEGRIETLQKNPTVLGYSYISGYTIEPVADSLENIYKALKDARDRQAEQGGQRDFNSYFGYLEGIRDFLNACREDWKEEDEQEKRVLEEIDRANEYGDVEESEITITLVSGGSNIPHGYNDEGERL